MDEFLKDTEYSAYDGRIYMKQKLQEFYGPDIVIAGGRGLLTLDNKNNIKCDPALPFQRLLLAAQTNPIDMDDILSYELSAFPLSLFETSIFLRKANKPNLADSIVTIVRENLKSS